MPTGSTPICCGRQHRTGQHQADVDRHLAVLRRERAVLLVRVPGHRGGPGLASFGLREPALVELCTRAGFTTIRRLPIDDPVNALYQARP